MKKMTKWMCVVSATALVLSVATPASASVGANLEGVDEDLQGTVIIMGGRVFDDNLEPIADVSEYEDAYEGAGLNIPDEQIEVTLQTEVGIEHAPDLPGAIGFGAGWGGPVKMEAPGCSGHDQYRNLQTITRGGKSGVVSKGIAYRMCGVAGASGWGWRHIDSEHRKDWTNLGVLFGKNWDEFAIWAIYGVTGSPSKVNYQPINKTYLYTAPIQLWKNGKLITTYMPKVSIADKTWRIITAFPMR